MSVRPSRAAVGRQAESLAADHLAQHGLTVVARNVRCAAGELDLVAIDCRELVFIEVRSRYHVGDDRGCGVDPASSVTLAKQRRLVAAAHYYLATARATLTHSIRFDVVAVVWIAGQPPRLTWHQQAFVADGGARVPPRRTGWGSFGQTFRPD